MWEYILNSAAWSLGGLAAGYTLGRMRREVHEINEKVNDHDDS